MYAKGRFQPIIQIDYNYQAVPSDDKVICWRDLPAIMCRPAGTQMQAATLPAAATGRQICKINADPVVADWSQSTLIHFQTYRSNYNIN